MLNGVVAPPLLVLIMLIAGNEPIIGVRRIGPLLTALGWLAVLALAATVVAMFVTS